MGGVGPPGVEWQGPRLEDEGQLPLIAECRIRAGLQWDKELLLGIAGTTRLGDKEQVLPL